jgi:uncharacterized membrane protein
MESQVTPIRWVLVLLLVIAILISIGITSGEFHFFGDETRHAMTGVFFRDFMADFPVRNPVQYAKEYYAKYPALGLLYWPPFFYFVEGLFFLAFGISVVSSRLAILAFALLGAYFWLRIAERLGSRSRAVLSALIFPLVPFVLTYERVTMLEIPLLALSLGAIHYWLKFLETEKRRNLLVLALFVVLAFYTNQKAVFLAVFLVTHFLVTWRWRLLKRWDVWVAGALSVALVLPWYALTLNQLALSYERAVGRGFGHTSRTDTWLYYLNRLPEQLGDSWMGVAMTCLAVAGLVWALLRAPRRHALLLTWVLSCYVCFTLIQEKTVRHTMLWIPPLVYFALVALEVLFVREKIGRVACAALALFFVANAAVFDMQKIGGMDEVAKFVVSQPGSDVVYYQGFLNGNFIFHLRKHDPEKRRLVAREKQVVAIRVFPGYGRRAILKSPEEVLEFFRSWGIRYVLVENFVLFEGLQPVQQVVQSDYFELDRIFTIWGSHENLKDRRVYVYRYKGEAQRTARLVELPMMTLRDDLRADLDRLVGRPWPN